jgi:hypothetical protein
MKHASLLVALAAFSCTACGNKHAEAPASQLPHTLQSAAPAAALPPAGMPAGNPAMDPNKVPPAMMQAMQQAQQPQPVPQLTQKAEVLSTINVTQFTYLEVKQGNNTLWIAATTTTAKKGDKVQFDKGTVMNNFTSKMLNRTFPSIIFVSRLVVDK